LSKIVVGVHGLGNKPPEDLLKSWWERSLCDGLNTIGHPQQLFKLEMAYWAHYIHPNALNPEERDKDNALYIEDPYVAVRKNLQEKSSSNIRRRVLDYLEKQIDKLLLNEDLTINFSVISDLIIHHFFKDLDIYYTQDCQHESKPGCSAKKAIQDELISVLKKNEGKQILLIAHSMGSIIAFDVLLQNPEIEIDTFVTLGSPLGIPVIMKKIAAESNQVLNKGEKIRTPDNIRQAWYNFSDLEDKVAINYDLRDDYDPNIYDVQPVDYIVYNDYVHQDKRNPHKSYGYLRTAQFAEVFYNFLIRDRSKFMIWISHIYRKWLTVIRIKP
jgi:hypothetical protein